MNKEEFNKEVIKLGITLTPTMEEQLETYYKILIEENKKYNLTGITILEDVYLKHFYDSLTLYKVIKLDDESICDIGTGAGFPGLVLKIVFPNLKVTLVESNKKKCNFLNIVKEKLNLNNLIIINARAEDYSKTNREIFDIVTSRAVAPIKHLLEYSIPLVKVNGHYIAMKSNIDKEIANIDNYYKKLSITKENEIKFYLPKENSLRTLIMYKKESKTNPIYPRRYNEIKKKDI